MVSLVIFFLKSMKSLLWWHLEVRKHMTGFDVLKPMVAVRKPNKFLSPQYFLLKLDPPPAPKSFNLIKMWSKYFLYALLKCEYLKLFGSRPVICSLHRVIQRFPRVNSYIEPPVIIWGSSTLVVNLCWTVIFFCGACWKLWTRHWHVLWNVTLLYLYSVFCVFDGREPKSTSHFLQNLKTGHDSEGKKMASFYIYECMYSSLLLTSARRWFG